MRLTILLDQSSIRLRKGCMPKIPFPQLPKEFPKNPLIEAMLRKWFMNGYYAGMHAMGKIINASGLKETEKKFGDE
ncbi:hypothetical protein TNIN_430881 [Trichonephila inaurata madagascariensis]|uniref:Uncharacterized protein n=1 Tax=Trichonephila inaurata madagascariensis TaxID=2747483 RepID=A0A8X6X567_9ARAC|nr:hypothetical protein TNIN_430881 [Trichonephila inaurata madagascariensis]